MKTAEKLWLTNKAPENYAYLLDPSWIAEMNDRHLCVCVCVYAAPRRW